MPASKILYIEGINPAGSQMVATFKAGTKTSDDTIQLTVTEANIGVNNNNNLVDDDGLRTGQPDMAFTVDAEDEAVEDQGDGFVFWWLRDGANTTAITRETIVDVAPLVLDIPPELIEAGFKFYLQQVQGSATIAVFKAASPGVSYLQADSSGTAQLAQDKATDGDLGDTQHITMSLTAGRNSLVFMGQGSGESAVTLALVVEAKDDPATRLIADSVKITFKPITQFWAEYSARGPNNAPTGVYQNYPLEDGRTVDMPRYPTPALTGGVNDTTHQRHYLVFVHGYNNTESEGRDQCSETYRRLFWMGFRGQMVGFLWHGDEGRIRLFGLDTGLSPFDVNVRNAFRTAPSFNELMNSVVSWAGSDGKVDVMAHSLGNLVVWEAARLHQNLTPETKMARNYLMVEAAVWKEAFYNKAPISYVAPDAAVTYPDGGAGDDVLQRHSWAFWFFQQGHDSSSVFSGVTNSYNPGDGALQGMRINDYWLRTNVTINLRKHYHRKLVGIPFVHSNPRYRTTEDTGAAEHPFDQIPTLFKPGFRRLVYGASNLNEPIGMVPGRWAAPAKATDHNWRADQHSDAWAVENSSKIEKRMWFPLIYEWYLNVVDDKITKGKD